MARYYWNRYKATPVFISALRSQSSKTVYSFADLPSGYKGFTFINGVYNDQGESTRLSESVSSVYAFGKYANGHENIMTHYTNLRSMGSYYTFDESIYEPKIDGYKKDAFVGTIQADENAYTNNARNPDGYWYERGAKVNTAPTFTQIPTQSTKKDIPITINLANYFSDPQGDPLSYAVSSSNPSVGTASVIGNTLTLTGKEIGSAWITVDASDGEFTTSQGFALNVTNTAPTVSVTSPNANMTLYENDVFNLAGTAADVNANQSVTIYAQVNLEQRIVLGIGLSNAAIPFSKQLKFKGGRLFDGDIGVTRNLTDGVPHTLKIWAQDSDGGQSPITERVFYVVPNRPPILTVDTVQPSGIINTDKFAISGTASDPDGNDMTASYRLNGGNSVALEIIEGKWAFDITLAQLQVGQNTIVVELMDSYDFKVSKTIKLNKNEVKTPILQSVARYKISPPKGSVKGVLLWIQRDKELDLTVDLSMTLKGEQESYVSLTATHTVPVYESVVEDEFYYETQEPKDNIILKLTTTRPNVNINNKIYLIMGVLE
ncbi:Ig-like domain-containing protein [Lysinibacillus sp. NPDC047702]|uniref:Ig-like domain-containing protein n=1 Tax=unclassified Lysinibacillus TaxID=2636778 RepID=UPI003D08483B